MKTLQDILVDFSGFISAILIPFLFGIAFLFFLINIFRYFILEGANEQSRDKAKRSALYGLAAFVFLLILWGLVGTLVDGLGLTRDRSLCSDYISLFRGDCESDGVAFESASEFPLGTRPTGGGMTSGGGGVISGGGIISSGTGSTGGGTGSGTSQPPQVSPLAELVFGTGKDATRFTYNDTPPQALATTPNLSATATCVDGINTLQQASRREDNQVAYLYTPTGAIRWTNVTDGHGQNNLIYDADTITAQATEDHNYLIHTHPRSRSNELGLAAYGHGPSTADFLAMCSDNESPATHIVVDWNGVWRIDTAVDSCPLHTTTATALPVIETYLALAGLNSSRRTPELERYLADSLPPSSTKTEFAEKLTANPNTFASAEMNTLTAYANKLLERSEVTVTYYDNLSDFCGSL